MIQWCNFSTNRDLLVTLDPLEQMDLLDPE